MRTNVQDVINTAMEQASINAVDDFLEIMGYLPDHREMALMNEGIEVGVLAALNTLGLIDESCAVSG